MSHLEHIRSTVQIGDHALFAQACEAAITTWQTKRDAAATKKLDKYLISRAAACTKYNKKLFVKLGWKKRRENDYSSTHYFNAIWNIFKNKLIADHDWYDQVHAFKDDSQKPTWWIDDDYYVYYNMLRVAQEGIAWKNKIDEILVAAKDENVPQLFVDSELYELIINWSK